MAKYTAQFWDKSTKPTRNAWIKKPSLYSFNKKNIFKKNEEKVLEKFLEQCYINTEFFYNKSKSNTVNVYQRGQTKNKNTNEYKNGCSFVHQVEWLHKCMKLATIPNQAKNIYVATLNYLSIE